MKNVNSFPTLVTSLQLRNFNSELHLFICPRTGSAKTTTLTDALILGNRRSGQNEALCRPPMTDGGSGVSEGESGCANKHTKEQVNDCTAQDQACSYRGEAVEKYWSGRPQRHFSESAVLL